MECSKPAPLVDIDFDDFADLSLSGYKDVHIHAMDIYEVKNYVRGLEIYYLVDGDIVKYVLHHKT
jgi:hypothetical protein